MTIIESIRRWFAPAVRSGYANPQPWLVEALGGGKSAAGVAVNQESALSYSAIWCGIRLMAETFGTLPWLLYRRLPDGGKERVSDTPLAMLLRESANPEMTSVLLRESLVQNYYLHGRCYAEIVRNKAGRPVELWPCHPSRVEHRRDPSGTLYFWLKSDGGKGVPIEMADMWQMQLMSSDGVTGAGLLQRARDSIGLGLASEKFGGSYYGNGARPGGLLEHPGKLSPDARRNLREEWNAMHQGADRAGRIAVLAEGMKYEPISDNPQEAQFIETRKFQVSEVSRWLNIPPHMLMDLERATFSNIEWQGIQFVTYTLRSLLVKAEQESNRKLLTEAERRELFTEFLVEGLLRGDQKSRYDAYNVGRQNGWLSANDIRRLENMNPLPAEIGDVYLVQGAMIPVELAGKQQQSSTADQEMPEAPDNGTEVDDEEDDAEDATESSRMLDIERAHRAAVEFHSRRLLTMERNAVDRAAKDAKGFLPAVEEFYRQHEARLSEMLAVQCEAWRIISGESIDAATVAAEHCRAAVAQILEASGRATADTLPDSIRAVTETWEHTGPARLAELVCRVTT